MDANEWRAFIQRDPATLTRDEIEQASADGHSSEWNACLVAVLAPQRCDEFRRITHGLGETLRREGEEAHRREFNRTPPLFRAACAFGDALERLADAHEQEDEDSMVDAMNEARGAYFFLVMLAEDAR
jgi:hypothetical protein